MLKCLSVGWWYFEICFLKADNVWTEIVYGNLELFVMGIIIVYVPLYYCFIFGGALNLDFAAISVLMKILCPIQMSS